jgi:hypothetical protein
MQPHIVSDHDTECTMQTFTLRFGLWNRLSLGNPLVRATDRVEAAASVLLVLLALLAIPVAGAMGTAVYDDLASTFAEQRPSRHEVDAVAVRASHIAPQPYERPHLTEIRWEFAGATHTDEIRTAEMEAGERVAVWVDDAGNRVQPVPTDEDAAAQAVIAAVAFWAAVVGSAVAAWALLRMRLNRVRFQAWDRELEDLADNGGRTKK